MLGPLFKLSDSQKEGAKSPCQVCYLRAFSLCLTLPVTSDLTFFFLLSSSSFSGPLSLGSAS